MHVRRRITSNMDFRLTVIISSYVLKTWLILNDHACDSVFSTLSWIILAVHSIEVVFLLHVHMHCLCVFPSACRYDCQDLMKPKLADVHTIHMQLPFQLGLSGIFPYHFAIHLRLMRNVSCLCCSVCD